MWDRKDPLSFSSMFLFFFFSQNIGGSIEPDAGVKKEENEKITKCLSNQAWIYNPRRYTSDENGVPFGKFFASNFFFFFHLFSNKDSNSVFLNPKIISFEEVLA